MTAPLMSSTVYARDIAGRGTRIELVARYVAPCPDEPAGSLHVSSQALDDMRAKLRAQALAGEASRSDVVDPWTLTSARLLAAEGF